MVGRSEVRHREPLASVRPSYPKMMPCHAVRLLDSHSLSMLVAVFSTYFKAAADNWPQVVVYALTGLQIEPDARGFARCPKATVSLRSILLHLVS